MTEPLISVLVPIYNVENFLARCIESILNQTYKNLEIVLLDDSSTDGSYEIAKKYASIDDRIKLLRKENEANLALTRNYLLNNYTGEYFVWVDSDDCIKPDYVEKLYTTLIDNNCDVACCNFHIEINHHKKRSKKNPKLKLYSGDDAVVEMVVRENIKRVLWNKIYKKSLMCELNFDPDVKFGEDFVFVVKYLKKCRKVAYINEKLYYYSFRKGSEIHQNYGDKQHSFIIALRELGESEDNPKIKEALLTWLCCTCVCFCFFARRNKPKDYVALNFLKTMAHENKHYLHKNRRMNLALKLLIKLGLITWCRKPKVAA